MIFLKRKILQFWILIENITMNLWDFILKYTNMHLYLCMCMCPLKRPKNKNNNELSSLEHPYIGSWIPISN